MTDLPDLTILLGPMTGISLALNDIVRTHGRLLAKAGVSCFASRAASTLLRRHLDDKPADARALAFYQHTAERPAFLAALNFFGPPHAGLVSGMMFPNAEKSLAGLADIAPTARFVICVDTLPRFFLAAQSEPLEERVRRTSWETLYELSWADLAKEIIVAVPGAELLVLTPDGTALRGADFLKELFGAAAGVLPDDFALLRSRVSPTGEAVLDRLISDGEPSVAILDEFQTSFASQPTSAELKDRLGLDKVTTALLHQRFKEDLAKLRSLPSVQVI